MPHPPDGRESWIAPALLALLYLATRLPFVYAGGSPDGDQAHMALGVIQGHPDGSGPRASLAYGIAYSRGYYAVLLAKMSIIGRDPDLLFAVMNYGGLAFGLIGQIAAWTLLRGLWGGPAALFGSLVWLFTPGWWEANT